MPMLPDKKFHEPLDVNGNLVAIGDAVQSTQHLRTDVTYAGVVTGILGKNILVVDVSGRKMSSAAFLWRKTTGVVR